MKEVINVVSSGVNADQNNLRATWSCSSYSSNDNGEEGEEVIAVLSYSFRNGEYTGKKYRHSSIFLLQESEAVWWVSGDRPRTL
jgi:hypothetical protein